MINIEVYVAEYPFETEDNTIYPAERAEEIKSCLNKSVADGKYYVWKLLERAVREVYALNLRDLKFYKRNGKWLCDKFFFSLSHSNNMVAAVVSGSPVGIDVEFKNAARFDKLGGKILTEREIAELFEAPINLRAEELNRLWTVKEAAFKLDGDGAFIPRKIQAADCNFQSKLIKSAGGEEYYLTVVSPDLQGATLNFKLIGGVKYGDE